MSPIFARAAGSRARLMSPGSGSAEAEIAKTEGGTVVRLKLRQEPRALRRGDDGFEVGSVIAFVHSPRCAHPLARMCTGRQNQLGWHFPAGTHHGMSLLLKGILASLGF
jgi:hypothetical protein